MSKIIKPRKSHYLEVYADNEIEDGGTISFDQLKNAKVVSSREEYIKYLPNNLKYLEVGVAWGYYSKLVAESGKTNCIHLFDKYDQIHICWGLRYGNVCSCKQDHNIYDPDTHEQYIQEIFSMYKNVRTIRGDSRFHLKNISQKYDYIYIDANNGRDYITPTLRDASKLIEDNGIIGLNDYVIWDGVIEDRAYGVVQAVNEFLNENKDWFVDALALHPQGFYDIYIKKGIIK